MKLSEWKLLATWFDGLISGWKIHIALVFIVFAMYVMPEGYGRDLVALGGFAFGALSRVSKQVSNL